MRVLAFILCLICQPLMAHEFWIEPKAYQIPADGKLEADLVNGEEFRGVTIPYLPGNFVNFVLFAGADGARVQGRRGDIPALNQDPLTDGLHVVAYQARNATVDYENWRKFQRFVDHKDLGNVREQHDARDLPITDFTEVYSRYSKSLIGVGDGAGADRRVGLETEIVALTNPYTDDLSDGFRVQLHYLNDVRANEQVEVFARAPGGAVDITLYRTDANGVATFPVMPGHAYMVDAVVLRAPSTDVAERTGAVWQTLWANLTFAVPE
ncbi:DUF4198 domain-containing protein [Cognatiyoonia sp. IB215446]|uniref:DUF4198 domain-containing protein n=1 Tax=Cognatiyoonia sp. IB215446 TaxID=3097355 RepID=UPI002A12A88A|nr:DUF4198 domain-containing protein [Cognatiyoonia sp. IB215446]MDX8348959.1 DUF4198 domain-containing protein [Cognatiyoonia sp. IB215446]